MDDEEEEINARDEMTTKQEKQDKKKLALLLLLLISTKVKPVTFRSSIVDSLLLTRQNSANNIAGYLGYKAPTVNSNGLAKVANNLSSKIKQTVKNAESPLSPKEIVKSLEHSVTRTIETEIFKSHNEAYVKVISQNNKNAKVRWEARLDKRTCPICLELNGQVFSIENAPPMNPHPRCRCLYVYINE